jgi:hypothetical protein
VISFCCEIWTNENDLLGYHCGPACLRVSRDYLARDRILVCALVHRRAHEQGHAAVTAGIIVRGLLDIGCLGFGLEALTRFCDLFVHREGRLATGSVLLDIGGLCFGTAGLIDLFRPW